MSSSYTVSVLATLLLTNNPISEANHIRSRVSHSPKPLFGDIASHASVFVQHNAEFTADNNVIGGRLAAGGNIKLQNSDVGKDYTNRKQCSDAAVGEHLGQLTVYAGGEAELDQSSVYNGHYAAQAILNKEETTMETTNCNAEQLVTDIIKFDDVFKFLASLADKGDNLDQTFSAGELDADKKTLIVPENLSTDATKRRPIVIFQLTCDQLHGIYTYKFQHLDTTVDDAVKPLLVFTVTAEENCVIGRGHASETNFPGVLNKQVVWNYRGTNLTFKNDVTVHGSLIATNADIVIDAEVTFKGTLMAQNLRATKKVTFEWLPTLLV